MARWQKNLYVLFLAELMSVMGFSVVNPFLSLYVSELSAGRGPVELWAGIVFSAQAFAMAITSPIWGTLSDRFGRKLMVQRAMFGSALVLAMMGFAHSVLQLAVLRAMQGAITGTVVAANTLVAASTPRGRTGYAMGMMQMGVWIGASVGPLIGGITADALGFRPAFLVTTALLLVAGLGVTLFVHEEFESPKVLDVRGSEVFRGWVAIIRAPSIGAIFATRFLIGAGRSMLVPFLPLFVASLTVSEQAVATTTGLTLGVAAATGALTSVYFGRLGDRIGRRRLVLMCSFAAAVVYLSMILVSQGWHLVVLYAVAGAALGGVVPVMAAIMTHASPVDRIGSVYGLDTSLSAGGKLISPLLGAAAISLAGFRSMFVLVACVFMLVTYVASAHIQIPPPEETQSASGELSLED